MGHAESAAVGLGEQTQAAGTGHSGLCLLAAFTHRAVCALAPLVVPLRLPPQRTALTQHACASGSLTPGPESLVAGLSTALQSTRCPARISQLTSACFCENGGC